MLARTAFASRSYLILLGLFVFHVERLFASAVATAIHWRVDLLVNRTTGRKDIPAFSTVAQESDPPSA
jgi:hypothetical protein